eukprot:scaffold315135_cov26-Tisochrysis_lutea.AAC.3
MSGGVVACPCCGSMVPLEGTPSAPTIIRGCSDLFLRRPPRMGFPLWAYALSRRRGRALLYWRLVVSGH